MAIRLTGRAVRERLKGKIDPDVLFVVEALAEYQNVMFQQNQEVAELVNQIATIVEDFVGVATQMKHAVDKVNGKFAAHDDDALTNEG
jgi:hypothetical protein